MSSYYVKPTPENKYGIHKGDSAALYTFNSALVAMATAQQKNQDEKNIPHSTEQMQLPTCYTVLDTGGVDKIDLLLAEVGIVIDRGNRTLAVSSAALHMFAGEMNVVFWVLYRYSMNTEMHLTGTASMLPYSVTVGEKKVPPVQIIDNADALSLEFEKTRTLKSAPVGARVILMMVRMMVYCPWSRAKAESLILGAAERTKSYQTVRCGQLTSYRGNASLFVSTENIAYKINATQIEGSPEWAWTGDLSVVRL